jgi:chromosome partitioning protein
MITVAVANLKGGSTKTTSAVFLAHVFAEQAQRVLLVDADKQGSALRWHEHAAFPFPVVQLPSVQLHRDLRGFTGDDRYDAVVIDTPPLEDHKGIVTSAMIAADYLLIPTAPNFMEYERLTAVRLAISEAADRRPDGQAPVTAVLLTRTVSNAASTSVFREQIRAEGIHVLDTQVARLEKFSQAYGAPVTRATFTAYGDALAQLLRVVPA